MAANDQAGREARRRRLLQEQKYFIENVTPQGMSLRTMFNF